MFDPDAAIPDPPVPNPPNVLSVDWNDSKNPGFKIGTEGDIGGSDQTQSGETIKGPKGSIPSPPTDYAPSFDKYRDPKSGENNPKGIFFTKNDTDLERSDRISYVAFSLTIRNQTHCLLYTSPSPRDGLLSRMPSSA